MKTKTIRQKIPFKTSAHDVYEILMDSKKHTQFAESVAKISRRVGGKFSVYDGYATGKNIELVEDKKIVQLWRAADWEQGHYSIVTFTISETRTGCLLQFLQQDVPQEHYTAIKQGWIDFYWNPMKEMIKNA